MKKRWRNISSKIRHDLGFRIILYLISSLIFLFIFIVLMAVVINAIQNDDKLIMRYATDNKYEQRINIPYLKEDYTKIYSTVLPLDYTYNDKSLVQIAHDISTKSEQIERLIEDTPNYLSLLEFDNITIHEILNFWSKLSKFPDIIINPFIFLLLFSHSLSFYFWSNLRVVTYLFIFFVNSLNILHSVSDGFITQLLYNVSSFLNITQDDYEILWSLLLPLTLQATVLLIIIDTIIISIKHHKKSRNNQTLNLVLLELRNLQYFLYTYRNKYNSNHFRIKKLNVTPSLWNDISNICDKYLNNTLQKNAKSHINSLSSEITNHTPEDLYRNCVQLILIIQNIKEH